MKDRIKELGRRILNPIAVLFHRVGLTPDQVTFGGLLLSLAAGAALAAGRFPLATLLLLVGSLCDVLDGSLARLSGRSSRFGAFLDSTVDRYAEMAVFMGLGLHFAATGDVFNVGLTFAAATGSLLVSYARARAEGLGLDCKVGWFERPERLALLIVAGLLQAFQAMSAALLLLALLSFVTAGQRIAHVWRITRGAGADGSDPSAGSNP
jgi:CDP-diacylglycerol--glycerol-3-phosphate 3-phosphatidyltransferase